MGERQEVKVTHGCGCGSAIAFLLVIGLIALVAEDIGNNPGTWIPVFIVLGLGAVAVAWWYTQQQQEQAETGPQQTEEAGSFEQAFPDAGEEGEKQCPDCAETVKAAARVCRFCGYRFDRA